MFSYLEKLPPLRGQKRCKAAKNDVKLPKPKSTQYQRKKSPRRQFLVAVDIEFFPGMIYLNIYVCIYCT